MNMRNIMIASLILNVMLIALVFMVKKNATDQAKEYVKMKIEPMQDQVRQAADIHANNKVLWSMVTELQVSPDKSKAAVKRLADSRKRELCNGKPCEGDQARLSAVISNTAGKKNVKVGWGLYSFTVNYDDKDVYTGINLDDLLDKATTAPVADEVASEGEAAQ